MTVARCSASHYRVPREVWWPGGRIGASLYEIDHIELVVVEVETNEGATGAGFTYTVGQGGSAVLALLEDEIAPVLLGRDPHEAEAIWHELHARLHFVGSGGVTAVAIAAADIALWDALACEAGLPLYRYLGAHRTELPAYASAVNLALSPDELVAQMAGYRDEGFRALKMKVGASLREDVERVRAVREAIGDECELMVDANMAWDVAEAGRRLRALEPFGLAWLEEPLPPHDVAGLRGAPTRHVDPARSGRDAVLAARVRAVLRERRDPDPAAGRDPARGDRAGAASPSATLDHGLPLAPHFIPEIHVHLACAVPNALVLEYLPIFERLLETPVAIRDGVARPSESPGHGMRFAAEVLEPFRVGAREVQLR